MYSYNMIFSTILWWVNKSNKLIVIVNKYKYLHLIKSHLNPTFEWNYTSTVIWSRFRHVLTQYEIFQQKINELLLCIISPQRPLFSFSTFFSQPKFITHNQTSPIHATLFLVINIYISLGCDKIIYGFSLHL